ncbi:MAG: hypothetical protein GXY03_16245, partial [Solirubrobacterales bacterium]|nr:hypothetical protein [Solirubrobacterales bacterium]
PAAAGGSRLGLALAVAVVLAGLAAGLAVRLLAPGRRLGPPLAALAAAGCGLAPLWHGLYDRTAWGPVALAAFAALVATAVAARPRLPSWPGLAALVAVALLAGWSALSATWAESVHQALLGAGRWALYAAVLALLLAAVRDDRAARLVVAAGAAATVAFAGYLTVRLALPGAGELFLGGRLSDPLGYVNGQAGLLLLALWPALALAECARRPALAGAGVAAAVLLCGLIALAQARAVAIAAVLVAALLLAAVPGRRRRAWALVVVALGTALAAGPLLEVYGATSPGDRVPDAALLRRAVLVLALAAAGAGGVWAALLALARRPAPGPLRGRLRLASSVALALVGLALAASVAAAVGDPAERAREGVRQFKALDVDAARESESRFASGGGNRYDYWRVAVEQWRESPVAGAGAGGYERAWFAARRTAEDVRQPHSLPLQALAELGLVGLAAVLALLAAVAVGFARRARAAGRDRGQRLLAVAAGGSFAAWALHSGVDWLHLLPGVTGVALCAAAALLAGGRPATSGPRAGGGYAAALVALAAGGALLVAGPLLADRQVAAASSALATSPSAALDSAVAAVARDGASLEARHAEAAARA